MLKKRKSAAKADPGFAGTLPIPVLLAAQHFTAKRDPRQFLRPVWVLPSHRSIIATDANGFIRVTLTEKHAKRLNWVNPGNAEAVAINLHINKAVSWLRSKKRPSDGVVRVSCQTDGLTQLRSKDGDKIDTTLAGLDPPNTFVPILRHFFLDVMVDDYDWDDRLPIKQVGAVSTYVVQRLAAAGKELGADRIFIRYPRRGDKIGSYLAHFHEFYLKRQQLVKVDCCIAASSFQKMDA